MKWPRIIGVVLTAYACIAIVGLVFLPSILGRKVDRQIAAIKAKGQPVCGADLAGPKIPNDENAAVIYQQAFQVFAPDKESKDFRETLGDFLSQSKRKADPTLRVKTGQLVERYNEALTLAEKAASRPKCRFRTNWQDRAWQVLFPYFADVRRLTRLTAASAILKAEDGRMQNAVERLELCYRVSESVKDEPTLIGFLVRTTCLRIASKALQDCVHDRDISYAQARGLYEILVEIDLQAGFRRAMQGERVLCLDVLRSIGEGGPEMADQISGSSDQPARPHGRPGWLWQLRSRLDELYGLRLMNRIVDSADVSYSRAQATKLDDDPDFPFYAIGTAIAYPSMNRARRSREEAGALLAGDRIFLALLAYEDKFGSYPESLVEMRSKLGWEIPEDPFSEKDFGYKRLAKGFLLYSVGEDLKDDGGRTVPVPEPVSLPMYGSPTAPGAPPSPGPQAPAANFDADYPYRTVDGQASADMIWQRNR